MTEKILIEAGIGEYEEKKSRFIAHIKSIETEEDAVAYVAEMKKQYWDARHNCYAYIMGERNEIQRFSDDGEPGGTAGKPILDVLVNSGLHNVIILVTRYFGGVLLGTGGLVRAYQKSSLDAIQNSIVIERNSGVRAEIITDYTGIGKIQYIMANLSAIEMNSDYAENVKIELVILTQNYETFIENVTEATSGKAIINKLADVSYGIHDGKPVII